MSRMWVLDAFMRLTGAVIIGVVGWCVGISIDRFLPELEHVARWKLIFTLGGGFVGVLFSPYLIFRPFGWLISMTYHVHASTLMSSTCGLLVGLIVASLVSIPLFRLDGYLGLSVPLGVSACFGFLGLMLGAQRGKDIRRLVSSGDVTYGLANLKVLMDTSAIIDGRIADLAHTGFLQASLIVPSFILDELRHIADSSDSLRRNRGRRGLEVLGQLRKESDVPIDIMDVDVFADQEVDRRLVSLARELNALIMTTDFNLNRVAELHGIKVLNINELANSLKPLVLPGEELTVNIVQEGREIGQGVAFLDDGTMVVVEGGRRYLNTLQDVMITRVLHTAAGRIIFAQPKAV